MLKKKRPSTARSRIASLFVEADSLLPGFWGEICRGFHVSWELLKSRERDLFVRSMPSGRTRHRTLGLNLYPRLHHRREDCTVSSHVCCFWSFHFIQNTTPTLRTGVRVNQSLVQCSHGQVPSDTVVLWRFMDFRHSEGISCCFDFLSVGRAAERRCCTSLCPCFMICCFSSW